MVPYLAARDGIELDEAAADLGITTAQLTKDIEQLFVCGHRENGFEDLIDVQYDSGYVRVAFTAGMDRPLRLTGRHAVARAFVERRQKDAGTPPDGDQTECGRR